MSEIISSSTKQTQDLAQSLLQDSTNRVFALVGDLGSGKTTFTQGLGKSLGIHRLLSPTYILIRQYSLTDSRFSTLYHIDLYRLNDIKEALALGLEEILADPSNLIVIEWPQKVLELLPSYLEVSFEKLPNGDRKITMNQK